VVVAKAEVEVEKAAAVEAVAKGLRASQVEIKGSRQVVGEITIRRRSKLTAC
jgi:hypothetical protein